MVQLKDKCAYREVPCPPEVLAAIYGPRGGAEGAEARYNRSLSSWWAEYAARKNDEEEEHVSDSLLYDLNHLPRMAPPPPCVFADRAAQAVTTRPPPGVSVSAPANSPPERVP